MMLMPAILVALLSTGAPPAAWGPALQENPADPAPRAVDRSDPRPAVDVNPLPPGMALPSGERTPVPHPGDLPRNGYVTGRFTEEGQRVDYTFEARAGELSLFDLATWGYARSWSSQAEIQILAADGRPLVTVEREGETAYRSFLPFVAPDDGSYRYRLLARDEMFRYTIVRHSDYSEADVGNLAIGERDRVHGHLTDPSDTRTFDVELMAGQEVALRVANDHAVARKQKDNQRRRRLTAAVGQPVPGRRAMGGDESGGRGRVRAPETAEEPDADFPELVLTVMREDQPLSETAPFVLLVPEQDGMYQIVVSATGRGQGGLFVLEVERAPPRVEVTGYVGDEEDDPVPGITLRFLREPSSEVVGEATSDQDGEFLLSVLPGRYSVHVGRSGEGSAEVVQANIEKSRELNVVWTR